MYKGIKIERFYSSNELIDALPELIRKDWNDNPIDSKIWSEGKNLGLIAIYRFSNGDEIELHQGFYKKDIVYKRKFRNKFKRYHHDCYSWQYRRVVQMLNKVIDRTSGHKKTNSSSGGSRYTQTKQKSQDPKKNHPKWDRYWTLILNIRQRTANLDKMGKDDPDRSGFINELNSAKRQAKAMKDKYNF